MTLIQYIIKSNLKNDTYVDISTYESHVLH